MKTNLQGLIPGITNEDYHAHSAISSTGFKAFLKSPAHFKCLSHEQTEAMYFGSMFHTRVLEKNFVVAPPKFDKRTKEGKEADAAWREAHKSQLLFDWFSSSEANLSAVEKLEGMAKSVELHPAASSLLSDGQSEVSAFSNYQGVPVRARFDWLRTDNIIVDLKSTKCAERKAFEREIFNYGYHISAAWYSLVHYLVTGKSPEAFILIAVEKAPPYAVSVFRLKPETLQLGHDMISMHLPRLKECLERQEWPAYPPEIQDVGIPTWAENQTLSHLMEGETVYESR